MKNNVQIKFDSLSVNESFARIVVSAFAAPLNPTVNELADIKTAVSEAVTNAIVHGYANCAGTVELNLAINGNEITVEVIDDGSGIADLEQAMRPFFTTCTDGTRAGMGFMVMKSFMDTLSVASAPDEGTRVVMTKYIKEK